MSAMTLERTDTAAGAEEPPLLEVRGLTKRFDVGGLFARRQVHALEDVSFSLRRGEVLALVGESGSGKSTIARVVARLIPPTAGEVRFEGKNVIQAEPRGASLAYRGDVQMIFQDPFGSLNPVQTIGHHLERPLRIHRKAQGRAGTQAKIEELLATVGLNPPDEFAAKYPHELSGGQRQRVAFARALAVEPRVLLADEPISMLDVSIRIGVMNLMERLKRERGIAYLYITHDIASARYIGDRTMVMYAGRIMEGAESDELIQQPAHPYTRRLLSAVPNPDAPPKVAAHTRWEPPRLIDPPPGCPFARQCPAVMDVCRTVMPGIETIAPGHWVRCHLYGAGTKQ